MLVLWIVGCGGAGLTGAPPLGDGPWNVTTAKGATLHVASYYEGTLDSQWYEVVESSSPEDARWLKSDGTNNWTATVHRDNQGPPTCSSPCTYLAFERTDGDLGPSVQDARKKLPPGSTPSTRYHDAGEYDVHALVFPANNPDGTPANPVSVARMFVSDVVDGHQTEVLCVKWPLRWARRDDDFNKLTGVRIDLTFSAFAALVKVPSKVGDCPTWYRGGYHRYDIAVGG